MEDSIKHEDTIKHIVRYMIQDPVFKSAITEELNNYENQNQKCFLYQGDNCKIKIDNDNRIFLPDYNAELKIASYQAKSLYLFYLLLPYRVSNKQLHHYESILITIYKEICNYKICDDYRAGSVIQGMLKRESGISDATNKIKKALKGIIQDELLMKQYIIDGPRYGERYILLPKQSIYIENKGLNVIKEQILHTNLI